MRKTWLAVMLCAGVAGCHHHGLPPDEDGGVDMATDMSAGEDMSIGDMGITDGSTKIVTFKMFSADYANAYCTHLMKCNRLDASEYALCVEVHELIKGWDIDSEIMKGRLEINELQCLDALSTARCDDSDSGYWTSRCNAYYNIPHQGNGAACLGDEECMSAYCQHAKTDGGTTRQFTGCPGTCAQPTAAGQPCIVDNECGPGGFCDTTSNTCQTPPGLGQTCDPAGLGCKSGLVCPMYDAAPKCKTAATQTTTGGACDPHQGIYTDMPSCAAGMYCQLQWTDPTPPATDPTNTGATCQPKLAKNMPCSGPAPNKPLVDYSQNQCEDGTLCYSTNGAPPTCQAYGSNNDACEPGTCKEGLYCDIPGGGASGTCKPFLADGQACDPNLFYLCASASPVVSDTCIVDNPDAGTYTTCGAPKSFGDSCIPGFEDSLCAPASVKGSSTCVPTTGGKGVCAPKCQ